MGQGWHSRHDLATAIARLLPPAAIEGALPEERGKRPSAHPDRQCRGGQRQHFGIGDAGEEDVREAERRNHQTREREREIEEEVAAPGAPGPAQPEEHHDHGNIGKEDAQGEIGNRAFEDHASRSPFRLRPPPHG